MVCSSRFLLIDVILQSFRVTPASHRNMRISLTCSFCSCFLFDAKYSNQSNMTTLIAGLKILLLVFEGITVYTASMQCLFSERYGGRIQVLFCSSTNIFCFFPNFFSVLGKNFNAIKLINSFLYKLIEP